MTRKISEGRMNTRTPKPDPRSVSGKPIPAAPGGDYNDELTPAQVDALRQHAPQDEAKMGPLVHEFTW